MGVINLITRLTFKVSQEWTVQKTDFSHGATNSGKLKVASVIFVTLKSFLS